MYSRGKNQIAAALPQSFLNQLPYCVRVQIGQARAAAKPPFLF